MLFFSQMMKHIVNHPRTINCDYEKFSLGNGRIIERGEPLKWARAKKNKDIEYQITLKGSYTMEWKKFSNVDEERSDGTFYYLVTKII